MYAEVEYDFDIKLIDGQRQCELRFRVGIGGSEALDALNSALTLESEECVRRFITLSLPSPDKTKKSKQQTKAEDGEVLRQRILAYRCGN
jgi:hypothetical protein